MDWKEVQSRLSRPFDPEDIGLKVQATNRDRTKGMVVAYIDARAAIDRLDEVVGPDGWYDTYEVLVDRKDGEARIVEVKCRLTVLGVSKEDVGEGDTLKAAFSDALKRVAVKFGIARYLYRLDKVWADLDERGFIRNPHAVKAQLFGTEAASASASAHGDDGPPWEEESGLAEVHKSSGELATTKQKQLIFVLMKKLDEDFAKKPKEEQAEDIRVVAEAALGRDVDDIKALTKGEASKLIEYLQEAVAVF